MTESIRHLAITECIDRPQLERFLAGALGPADADAVAAHVEDCAACQGVLERLAGEAPPLPTLATPPAAGGEEAEPPADFLDRLLALSVAHAAGIVHRRPRPAVARVHSAALTAPLSFPADHGSAVRAGAKRRSRPWERTRPG
jgi:hypothetical protein